MENNIETSRALATRIYDLDSEVYRLVGSSLGRTFTGDKETSIRNLTTLISTHPQGHLLRSEIALIGNMARTIRNKEDRSRMMHEYNEILHQIAELPESFGSVDILDQNLASLNTSNLHQKFSKDDHLIICIGRTHGSAGTDIGFALADALKINYYDVEIFNRVLERLEAEKNSVTDRDSFTSKLDQVAKHDTSAKRFLKDFSRYHGLPKKDAVFFNQSDLIVEMAKKEDFIVMGKDGTQHAALGGLAVAGGCRNEHTQHQECCQYAYGLHRAAFPKCFHYLALLSLMEVPIATQSVGASGM